MPGSNNNVQYSNGYRLEESASEEWQLMQATATDVSCVNNAGNPEGIVPANMGSLCHDRTNGDLYVKHTGTGNTGWLLISTGGSTATDSFAMQTGISPVVPTGAGLVTFNGAVVAAGTNPIRTDGTGANTMAVEVQISQAIGAADVTKIGLANFDSAAFDVSATGFVQLNGGGIASTAFDVQANTAPGTDPVVPTAAGVITVNGAAVANHSVVLETRSRAANAYNLEVQYAAAAAATDATKSGVSHFNSAQFSVDANGFVSATSALTTDLHTARFIVSAGGTTDGANYTTIASAITAAVAATGVQTVFIQPGTYTENLTVPANINLTAYICDPTTPNVTIIGKISCSDAGTRSFSAIRFQTNADNILAITGTVATIVNFNNCYLNIVHNVVGLSNTSTSASSEIGLNYCLGNLGSATASFFAITKGNIRANYTKIDNTSISVTASTMSNDSSIAFNFCTMSYSITSSNTSSVACKYCLFRNGGGNTLIFTLGGTGSNNINYCIVESGTASAISISAGVVVNVTNTQIDSTNANAITGAGTINFDSLSFTASSSNINTTTQVPLIRTNDAVHITTPGGYPYTTIPQDAVILVDTSAARTITPLASPTTGQRHIIKDNVGSAAANNITVTPSGKNIDGVASKTITTNYGSMTIVFNGTQWNVL